MPLTFQTKAQEQTYTKVKQLMAELFGEMPVAKDDYPGFMLKMGSTFAHINVNPWGDDSSTVAVRAWVVLDVEATPELMHYLLRENDDFRFGAFGLDKDDDVFFEHAIVGDTLDKDELRASVKAVLSVADHYDDEIQRRWGGRKALDPQQ